MRGLEYTVMVDIIQQNLLPKVVNIENIRPELTNELEMLFDNGTDSAILRF